MDQPAVSSVQSVSMWGVQKFQVCKLNYGLARMIYSGVACEVVKSLVQVHIAFWFMEVES